MEGQTRDELGALLKVLPPVEFCCIYGSSLHPNNHDKSSMIDCILGVADPQKWHAENLKMNKDHYASWLVHLGGAKLITEIADEIGVGVHFNPFVSFNDKVFKYGVVRMHDLIQDLLSWDRFYLSGRLQKPVHMITDNLDIENVNSVNLRAATSAALLLLPSEFTEESLYAGICSLSYRGDLRMLFAEDKDKVKKIVKGQFGLFQEIYKPILEEYATKDLLRFKSSSSSGHQVNMLQDCSLSAASSLVCSLPSAIRGEMGFKLGERKNVNQSGRIVREIIMSSKEEGAECLRKVMRNKVMIGSARQAVSGLLTVGVVGGFRYLGRKMRKAWNS
ncbi:phosphatidate cytidylyltransferase, mitochondrial [Impatiens glandulifera]|uniref:phosphatidate cytidylyltransferase, mitochondrial n=1 Tax=Impatiens glandulifera TaxID=253017 RepID=UPI001FB181D1|nr:phosphatidate cytidylyltransferase, mitochondrial [Impatiens glandulifera]